MDIIIVDDCKNSRQAVLKSLLQAKSLLYSDDPFYVVDVDNLVAKVVQWRTCMPRVQPFYAIKCNTSLPILRTLAALGLGFDVAGKVEMEKMLRLKVPPHQLVYSNPCKAVSGILYAKTNNVSLTVFDSEDELYKIREFYPEAELMVRLRHDDESSSIIMGDRFGVNGTKVRAMIDKGWELGLKIVGVAFHVGCGSSGPGAYASAIEEAKTFFDYAEANGKPFRILDIGGGFPGSLGNLATPFAEYCLPINETLDACFPEETGIQLIAEPGQFFVATAQSLITPIIGKKSSQENESNGNQRAYILNDGFHGSCRDIVTFNLKPEIQVYGADFEVDHSEQERYSSALYGPSCDPMDYIVTNVMLPELQTGQWLEFARMGAYTNELFCNFNGFNKPRTVTLVSDNNVCLLE